MAKQEIVTIKPKKNSRRFRTADGSMSQIFKVDEDGREVEKNMGNFNSERFPNSRQMFRIIWSRSKNRWKLGGFTDAITPELQAQLDTLVVACKLKYPRNHQHANKYIETADIFDAADPFFSHKDLKVISQEGELLLNKSVPVDRVILMGLREENQFAAGGEKLNPLTSSRVKYIITDKTIDTAARKKSRNKKMEAIKLLDTLTSSKKIKIALAIGAIPNADIDMDIVEDLLFSWAEDSDTKVSNKMTRQEFFIHVCKTDNEELEIRTLISKSKSAGILKKQRNTGFILFGDKIGKTDKQVFDYLKNEDNQDVITRIEEALKQR